MHDRMHYGFSKKNLQNPLQFCHSNWENVSALTENILFIRSVPIKRDLNDTKPM